MEALVTANEFAAILRISRRKFDAMYLKGETPACLRIGRQRFWQPQDIAAWMSKLVEARVAVDSKPSTGRQQGWSENARESALAIGNGNSHVTS